MKKILIVLDESSDKEKLFKSALFLKKEFGYKILPLYVKNVKRDEIIPTTMNGMMVSLSNNAYIKEREALENEEIKKMRQELIDLGVEEELYVEFGFPWEIIKEYLKITDMLVFEKGEFLSELAITILKNQFKPILLIGEKPITDFKKILIASDDGVKVNKSATNFMRCFPEIEDFTMVTINHTNEEDKLSKYMLLKDKKITFKHFDDKTENELFLEDIERNDILIMGNLSKSYLFEKITRRRGISILENSKTSIFIG